MAFKLDRDAHFATGIGATDILGAALHTPHRWRGPQTGNELSGAGTECQPMTPLVKRGSLHHTARPPGWTCVEAVSTAASVLPVWAKRKLLTHIFAMVTH